MDGFNKLMKTSRFLVTALESTLGVDCKLGSLTKIVVSF